MKLFLKKFLPKPILSFLIQIKNILITNRPKRRLFKKMQKKHKLLLQEIKGKEKIKVVFLAIHKSVWKVDTVFQKMLKDPYFEPLILVCPYTIYGEERMWEDMNECYSYFEEKGYPLLSSYNKKEKRWLSLEEIQPDIVFFTNPHNLTRKEYYEDAYLNYLTCYVPYFFLTTTHGDDQSIYNQDFHNSLWLHFMPHDFSFNVLCEKSASRGENAILSGFPFIEDLIVAKHEKLAWKLQKIDKIKIIFAPHHTIEEGELKLSNFILVADKLKDIAEKYKERIQWAFKPHPILRSKLYVHNDWGKLRTDTYYKFWENQSYTQLEEGEYIDLFLQSDGIIHDSGSFLAEYLFVNKPCGYLMMNGDGQIESINEFGHSALESYIKIKTLKNLEDFIIGMIEGSMSILGSHDQFISCYRSRFLDKNLPSIFIIENIKKLLRG